MTTRSKSSSTDVDPSLSVEDSILELPGSDQEAALNIKLACVWRMLLICRVYWNARRGGFREYTGLGP